VGFGVTTKRGEREVVDALAIAIGDAVGDVVPMFVDRSRGRTQIADGVKAERFRRVGHAFVRKDLDAGRM